MQLNMKKLILSLFLISSIPLIAAEPKKVLVVGVTTEFRHSSIETAEKVLTKLGEDSKAFTVVDVAKQPSVKIPQKPSEPRKPAPLKADADDKTKAKFESESKKYESDLAKYQAAMAKWTPEDDQKVKDAQAESKAQLKAAMDKLSPENLKNYDAVIFANTTGDLPIPDRQAFINWVREGHAFIGMHSASDTLHHGNGDPAYIAMLGGEFETHGAQVSVDAINKDKEHPATKHLGDTFTVYDEIYIIKNYHPENVHELLVLDKHPNTQKPGHYPISWCKEFGKGKVFYTSLGHREDVWNPEEKGRKNSKEVSEAYQQHILGGIKWALGLVPGDATPQTK
jgi:type 1 glutamine amidotransferase